MEPRGRAIVLLSGGIDSAVALHWALAQGWRVTALTFDYHGRPQRERSATVRLAEAGGVDRLLTVPLPFLAEVPDLPAGLVENPALARAPEGYVPARNLVFYSVAAHYAEIVGARRIIGGHHSEDGETFPDASPAFFTKLEEASAMGVWSFGVSPFTIELPLTGLTKRGVLDLARALGAPLHLTWSCYWDGERPCGRCASCRERALAFSAAGIADPLPATPA